VPLFLINGTYRVTGGVPGGDSVRFYPDDPQAFSALGLVVRANSRGGARLRLTGIDALELAYTPRDSATVWHQPLELAQAGAAALATALGFDKVERDESGKVVMSLPSATPGHVLTQGADAHGRVVGFAFTGRRRGKITDLAPVRLDVAGVRDSVNWMLLRQGLAYPVAFSRMYPDLRAELAAAASHARTQQRGVWPRDVTQAGFRLADREHLQDEIVLLPRLFRRLVDYLELEGPGGVNLSGVPAYLAARADRLMIMPEGHVTGLDTVVEMRQQQVRLTVAPERLVFFERFFLAR
jgi:endonuclease YncB( thermonuclease family)